MLLRTSQNDRSSPDPTLRRSPVHPPRPCGLYPSGAPMTRSSPDTTDAEYEQLMFRVAERAYFKASETSDPQDWLQAGLMAQQHRNALTKARASRSSAATATVPTQWKSPRCGQACWDEIKAHEANKAALLQRILEVIRDRDEWKAQHENLLTIRQQELRGVAQPSAGSEQSKWWREMSDREPDHGQYANGGPAERATPDAAQASSWAVLDDYRSLAEAIDHTLSVHGHMDADTPLHDRLRRTLALPSTDGK